MYVWSVAPRNVPAPGKCAICTRTLGKILVAAGALPGQCRIFFADVAALQQGYDVTEVQKIYKNLQGLRVAELLRVIDFEMDLIRRDFDDLFG